jgi:hypothetical protein
MDRRDVLVCREEILAEEEGRGIEDRVVVDQVTVAEAQASERC